MVTAQGKAYPDNLTLPTLFEDQDHQFVDCAVGRDHMAVITKDGKLMTMGSEDHGKLGHNVQEVSAAEKKKLQQNKITGTAYKPQLVQQKAAVNFVHGELEGKIVKQVACGFQHTAAITSDGELYTWGLGKAGALGHGVADDVLMPKKVEGLQNIV